MPHGATSPVVSENDFDITRSLFKDDAASEDEALHTPSGKFETGGILDIGLGSDGDDDEAFIAAQQAASNRKASNLKGNSVKKGGGFQVMGIFS